MRQSGPTVTPLPIDTNGPMRQAGPIFAPPPPTPPPCPVRMHDYRASHGVFQRGRVAAIVEEADLIGCGRLQRCDAGEHLLDQWGRAVCRVRDGCQRMWAGASEEPWVAHWCFNHRLLP